MDMPASHRAVVTDWGLSTVGPTTDSLALYVRTNTEGSCGGISEDYM